VVFVHSALKIQCHIVKNITEIASLFGLYFCDCCLILFCFYSTNPFISLSIPSHDQQNATFWVFTVDKPWCRWCSSKGMWHSLPIILPLSNCLTYNEITKLDKGKTTHVFRRRIRIKNSFLVAKIWSLFHQPKKMLYSFSINSKWFTLLYKTNPQI